MDEDDTPLLDKMTVEGLKPKLSVKDYCALVVALVMIILGITGIIIVCVYQTKILYEYGIVLDAGSTHTDLMVYRWSRKEIIQNTGLVEQIGQCTSQGGSISSYSLTNPHQAGSSFKSCIDHTAARLVPSYLQHKSAIYLGATAGMRLVQKVNKSISMAIMQSVRQTLHKSNFKFKDDFARIISGEEEGLSSWVTVNYLEGRLFYREISSRNLSQESNAHLVGALDMGGASTQITFPVQQRVIMPSNYIHQLTLYGRTHNLYTHSYLCYGKKEAERKFMALLVADKLSTVRVSHTVDNPCGPAGLVDKFSVQYITQRPCVDQPLSGWNLNSSHITFKGTANASKCLDTVERLFNFSHCTSNNCSFNGVYQPSTKDIRFVAFSSYYYLIKDLNFTESSNITLKRFKKAADEICTKSWAQIIKGKRSSEILVYKTVCFDAVYIYTILKQGYHLRDDTLQVQFRNKERGRSLGWALGFMINATNLLPTTETEYRVQPEAFIAVVIVSGILISLGVLLIIMATRKVIDRWKSNKGLSRA